MLRVDLHRNPTALARHLLNPPSAAMMRLPIHSATGGDTAFPAPMSAGFRAEILE